MRSCKNLLQIGLDKGESADIQEGSVAKGGKQTYHAIHFIEHDRDKARRAPYACGLCRADA